MERVDQSVSHQPQTVETSTLFLLSTTSRRRLLGLATGAVMSPLLAACGGAEPTKTVGRIVPITYGPSGEKSPYSLAANPDGSLVDDRAAALEHPFLQAVQFSFDAGRAGGSLVLDVILKKDAEYRLIAEETDKVDPKNPGFIFNAPTKEKAGPVKKWPVVRFGPKEEYLVSLGFKLPGEDCVKTYTDANTYYVTRDQAGKLQGRMEGLRTLSLKDPNFKPRDSEAAQAAYWNPSCLT